MIRKMNRFWRERYRDLVSGIKALAVVFLLWGVFLFLVGGPTSAAKAYQDGYIPVHYFYAFMVFWSLVIVMMVGQIVRTYNGGR